MQVNINIKKAARLLSQFIASKGGDVTKHCETLELLAQMCGFDSYRAYQAAAEKAEAASKVVIEKTIVDWQIGQGLSPEELPEHQRGKYTLKLEEEGSQFRLMIHPQGLDPMKLDGQNVMDMLIEINDGLPCVHLTNDPYDEMLLTVFATRDGLYVRRDGGETVSPPYAEGAVAEALKRNDDAWSDVWIVALDTAKKYAND